MKLWSWGNAPVGVINQTALTDDGSVYAETQCGAMETQLDFSFSTTGKNETLARVVAAITWDRWADMCQRNTWRQDQPFA